METVTIILLGESNVGKTSLLLRFIEDTFKDSLPKTSIRKYETEIKIEDKLVKLTLWDTGGQAEYYNFVQGYYNIADGALLVYDVQNANTFSALSKWSEDFRKKNEKAEILIVGNKADDDSKTNVNEDEVKNFVRAKNLQSIEVSAKSGGNVNILFHDLVHKILANKLSEDNCMRELGKEEAFISSSDSSSSSVSPEQHTTGVISSLINTSTTEDASIPCVKSTAADASIPCVKSTEADLFPPKYTLNTRTTGGLHTNTAIQLEDEEDPSGEYGFVFYSIEDRTLMADPAEIAEEFFKRAGENV